ncbi:SMP-30/gluconolactonase/LRE family protein [Marinactinospora rubrisoli]|uniref:SMP-30/gluconolactonase/LRE family protein n=1 Tax=Marinactinospora rubrisoli TaxID=2715399 RepID=A0ABW2KGI4_9ACTN
MPSFRLRAVAATAILSAVLTVAPAATAATSPPAPPPSAAGLHSTARISTAFELPGDRVYPEGIAADPRTGVLYAGSYADGTVFRVAPGRRVAEIFLPAGADGRTTANGLAVDRSGRLWVTDSTAGVTVYDTRDREPLARFDVPGDAPFFVNDVTVAPDGTAYLTDSLRNVVYRVTPGLLARTEGGAAALPEYVDLSGELGPREPGVFSLNGIVTDGRHLLTADMTEGGLYRVDLVSGSVRRVALEGGDMLNADGLELRGGTLWAAHNTTDAISRWRLDSDGTTARRERLLTDDALQLPTTLVHDRGRLFVVRSQFDQGGPMGPGTPETPFTVASVRGI